MLARPVPRGQALLCLAGGGLLPLAFAPFGLWPLAPLAIALLFLAWLDARPRQALLRGWLFGLGMFGVGVSWIHESFQFSHVALPLAIVLTALFVFFLALFPGLLGYLLARFPVAGRRARLVLLFPAAWVLMEWVRGWFFTGFPWLQLGYSQSDAPLAALAPVTGVLGLSWLLALTGALLAVALLAGRAGWWRPLLPLFLLWPAPALLERIQWTQPEGEPLKVALIQGNVPQDRKWLPSERGPTLRRYLGLTREHWDADLVVWPETAIPAYRHEAQAFLERLGREAASHATDLLVGIPVRDLETRETYNSVLAVTAAGNGLYHKHHLVPFGEFLPLRPLLEGIVKFLRIPLSDFSPGRPDQAPLRVAGRRVGISICYEGVFGEEIIASLPAAELLVNVSNDAWFGDSFAQAQHLQMARLRALETGRYLLRATNTGITAIIGPQGQVLARAPQFQAHALAGEVRAMNGMTPYAYWGNAPCLAALFGVLAWWGYRRVRGLPAVPAADAISPPRD